MKLPLVTPLKSRNGTSNKDGRLTNVLADQRPNGELVAQVRPGLVSATGGSGNGNGLVDFNGELISVYGASVSAGTSGESGSWTKINSTTMLGIGTVACNGSIAINVNQRTTDGYNWTTFSVTGTPPEESYWWIGNDLYGIRISTPRLKKSTDNGSTWTNVSILPSGAGDSQTLAYFNNTMFLYDGDLGQMWSSTDKGLNWTEEFPASFNPITNQVPFYEINGVLYLFDGINGVAATSNDGIEFNSISLFSNGITIGHYESGLFYGHDLSTGDIFTIPISDLTSFNVIANVPPASNPGLSLYQYGQPFKIGSSMFCFGLDGVYIDQPTLPIIGTVTDSFFDFVQSTT